MVIVTTGSTKHEYTFPKRLLWVSFHKARYSEFTGKELFGNVWILDILVLYCALRFRFGATNFCREYI